MLKRKGIILSLVTILILTLTSGCSKQNSGQETNQPQIESDKKEVVRIGEVQVTEYFGLDLSRKGFRDALAQRGYIEGENLEIEYRNAQSDPTIGQNIAQSFASNKKDLIHAVATPVAQASYNATKEIPIVFTAVTDPVDAGIVKNLEKSGTNVCGMSDMVPMRAQFDLIKKFFPEAKKLGIVYSLGDTNSSVKVREAKLIADEYNLEIIAQGATTSNDVGQTVDSLLKEIDVLYVPTDSTVVPAMPIIISKSLEKKIPIIPEEKGQVELGALATEGIDFYKLGYESGLMAADILDGKSKVEDMPSKILEDRDIYVNKETLEKLGLSIPEEIKDKVEFVEIKE